MGRKTVGGILLIIGLVFLLINTGFSIDFLAYPYVFPSLMISFGLLKIVSGFLNLKEFDKILGTVIFFWVILTIFAFAKLPIISKTFSFDSETSFSSNFEMISFKNLKVSSGAGYLLVSEGKNNITTRYSGEEPKIEKTGDNYEIAVGAGQTAVYFDKEYEASSNMTANLGVGYLSIYENLNFSNLILSNGVGGLTINITEGKTRTVTASIGIGAIKINIPKDVEYSIEYSVGLGALSGERSCSFSCSGTYKTQEYETSSEKVDIIASVGIGAIVIS